MFIDNLQPNPDLTYDAWGRPKQVYDKSVFRGLWTYDVNHGIWKEFTNGVELAKPLNATSVDGGLHLASSSGNVSSLYSQRHPRYQPNRGHLWSSSCWFPVENEAGTVRDFGLATPEEGAFFRYKNDLLYAVIRTNSIDTEYPITDTFAGADWTKGHLFDIQFQWRGVGDYFFYIDSSCVYKVKNLNSTTVLPSIRNPAISTYFQVSGDAVIGSGCVDVTSEGGSGALLYYQSISSPLDISSVIATSTATDGTAIMAIKCPNTFYGKYNSRDSVLNRVTTFCKDEAATGIWKTRDPAVIGGIADNADPTLGWADVDDSSPFKYMIGGTASVLNTAFAANHTAANSTLVAAKRVEIDFANTFSTLTNENAPFHLTNGDYLIISVKPDGTNKKVGCSIEWAEEV